LTAPEFIMRAGEILRLKSELAALEGCFPAQRRVWRRAISCSAMLRTFCAAAGGPSTTRRREKKRKELG
jgi:hypothetical protein